MKIIGIKKDGSEKQVDSFSPDNNPLGHELFRSMAASFSSGFHFLPEYDKLIMKDGGGKTVDRVGRGVAV